MMNDFGHLHAARGGDCLAIYILVYDIFVDIFSHVFCILLTCILIKNIHHHRYQN